MRAGIWYNMRRYGEVEICVMGQKRDIQLRSVRASAVAALVGLVLSWVGFAAGENLMECPDCGAKVSKRALMCPTCGCKGSIIEEEAKKLEEAKKPKEPDKVVRVKVNSVEKMGRPVQMGERNYVVLPFEDVMDVETLVMGFVSTNLMIRYGVPEVALNAPVVRFEIEETNLVFAADIGDLKSSLNEGAALSVGAIAGWEKVQPRDLKAWGKILMRLRAGKSAAELPRNAHPFYRQLADRWVHKKGETK